MWNLSLEDIQRAKEELKGRRAAIQARYEDEVKSIDADLQNIEAHERAADMFVARHKAEMEQEEAMAVADLVPAAEPAWAASDPVVDAAGAKSWRAHLDKNAEAEPAAEAEPVAAAPGAKGASRWRMHIGSGNRSEGEPA
jgi:hypothetical protein